MIYDLVFGVDSKLEDTLNYIAIDGFTKLAAIE